MFPYLLEVTVFVSAAAVMILEIVGARILSPHLGASIYTWTSLIGVVLGSLSLGYFLGGKLADKGASLDKLSLLLFLPALWIGFISFQANFILLLLDSLLTGLRTTAIVGAMILFAPPSIFLGAVAPYATRLKMKDLTSSGQTVGNFSALGALGSILGTFLSGFWLLSYLGSSRILLSLSAALIILSIITFPKKQSFLRLILVFLLLLSNFASGKQGNGAVFETDTRYSHVKVIDTAHARYLQINKELHSAIFKDSSDLVFPYTNAFLIATSLKPDPKQTLMIGGGAFTFPSYFLSRYPETRMDVVEIDPELEEVAKNYFGFKENPRMKLHFEDGRLFLNSNQKKYDIIFGDAFSSFYSLPHHLTTLETVKRLKTSLSDDGVVVVNIISSLEGPMSPFLRAEVKTYRQVFPFVYVLPVNHPKDAFRFQNIFLVAMSKEPNWEEIKISQNRSPYLENLWQKPISVADVEILTDDLAPVDRYLQAMILSL